MIAMRQHGGRCCGMRHIHNFFGYDRNREQNFRTLQEYIRNTNSVRVGRGRPRGRVLEIVLTNQQCRANPQLLEDLHELGFKLMYRFANENSHSICNVFIYNQGDRTDTRKGFQWPPRPRVEVVEENNA